MLSLATIFFAATMTATVPTKPQSMVMAERSAPPPALGRPVAETPPAYSPFDAATLAPADVTAYIHVDHAARIRKELADRPIAKWINSLVETGEFSGAWGRLAKAAKLSSGQMFDFVMGERFTLLLRNNTNAAAAATAPPATEWVLVTGVDQGRATAIVRELNVRVHEPRAGFAIAELPEQDILIARDEHHLIVGPNNQSRLFYEVLPRVGARNQQSLATEPCFADARGLGMGCAAVFVRHSDAMGGGWSLALADLKGDQLAVAHAAHFDHSPFQHGVTKLVCDCSPVRAFENRALVAMIQPTDIGPTPLETFIVATLHDGLISKSMRHNSGSRQMMIVGEEDARQADQSLTMLTPTLVTCLELKDKEIAPDQLDRKMVQLTRRMNDLRKGSALVEIPAANKFQPGEPRHIDLSPAMDDFAGGFPIMRTVSLNWTVADGPDGAWFVVGSHPSSMNEVVKTLKAGADKDARFQGKFDSAGIANGVRIGKHVENLTDQVQHIAPADKVESVRMTLKLMSQLALGCQTCRWQLERPNANDMRLNVQVTLSPPESAR